ncbi:MAG: acyltransferase family protein [Xanthomonadales bacterium]|nr:acyltransferase family protein [Xanthomonadales bacterium]
MTNLDHGAATAAPTDARIHAFDHLRALAMLTGVVFHAALAYSPMMHGFWPTAYRTQSSWIDASVWLLHLVRMPLFFLVSGYFTAWLISRRGWSGLLRQRLRRILIPLLVAWPLVQLAISASTHWAAVEVAQPSPFLSMVSTLMAMPDPPALPPSTGHLWFLYYLLLFTLLAWTVHALGWARWLAGTIGKSPNRLVLILPLLVAPGFYLSTAPHPAPESLFPQFWAMALYGPFFAFGACLLDRVDSLQSLRHWLWPGLLICALAYVAFLVQLDHRNADDWNQHAPWTMALLQAVVAAWGTLAALIAGVRWLARPNALMAWLARSSYWTYLLHLPVLFALQYWLLDQALSWPFALLLSCGLTLAICLFSYEVLVRRTRLRWWVG